MSDSVLDRIRQNRQRPAVAIRDDSLVTAAQPPTPDKPVNNSANNHISAESVNNNTQDVLGNLKAELAKIPETTRHSAIVLEKQIDQALTVHCKENKITIEAFLEAAWIHASSNPSTMKKVMAEAKRRYDSRKRAGKLRRLITMIESDPIAKKPHKHK